MDPIGANAMPPAAFNTEPGIPAPPDAADVRDFQSLYGGEPGFEGLQPMVLELPGSPGVGGLNGALFQDAMERMVEVHEKSCLKLETLIDRVASSSSLSPAEMLQIQVSLADTTTGLATYQSFDKKTDEGVKALMTGQ